MYFELFSLIVLIALWTVKTYSEFHVNIFSNHRDIIECQSFFSRRRRRQGYGNTSGFLRKQPSKEEKEKI